MIKHIFSDMDGTILNNAGYVSDENASIIKKANIPFTLVSARAPMEMSEAMDKLDLKTPQIGFNGGLIFEKLNNDIKVIDAQPIDLSVAKRVFEIIQDKFNSVSLSWYDLNHWYSERIDDGIKLERNYTNRDATLMSADNFFAQKNATVFKLMMILFDKQTMHDLKQYLNEQNLPGVSIQQSSDTYLEITSDKALKSRGIQYIIDHENLHRNEMMAFGDGHNDLPMLEMVDYPVVMQNALPDILKVGKFITKSNEDNGVGYAMKTYLKTI
ncbi:MAG: HAD family hydrolase [Companilactobacillus sp.]|jgi:Cof subfamily protein (haloacid dehalogenase superfamily)|nr:HAD family hydrolase [Companilactobacillus sp.]MCH4009799.1 HAD family hydrolase [Companilactobacillus sp.]MCH4052525.1 HAD family hydrolase [Companilactobacillus sp.]MCH4077741.1 HAD family hydrolase [Companilactobacillus sp.]MCH4126317.1 HAD family hydrolase [Companilactobacillus sp.]MCI1312025.1 HAD family hydrolase [Companilactobacillus sp.]